MGIQNTKKFQKFVENQKISDDREKDIEEIIDAFSEYVVAVNPNYIYNKTYLSSYIEEFVQCQKELKRKYNILKNEILTKLMTEGIKDGYEITIDGAWKYEKGEIKLTNHFNPNIIKRNKMQIEIELIHEKGFLVANEISLANDYEKILNEYILEFTKRRKEVIENAVQ